MPMSKDHTLNYPYGWWEPPTNSCPKTNMLDRIRDGDFGECNKVDTGRYACLSSQCKSTSEVNEKLDQVTHFDRVDQLWKHRLRILHETTVDLEMKLEKAQQLRHALIAQQIGQLAVTNTKQRSKRIQWSLAEAVAHKSKLSNTKK